MIALLSKLARRPRSTRPAVPVTIYSRAHCGCCDKALRALEPFRRRYRLEIETVDVDADPELAARYGTSVPVVAIDGKVRFKGLVNPVLLQRLLAARGS